MVVCDREGPTVVAQYGVEDFPHGKEGTVDAALAHPNNPPKLIRGIADEHDHALASCAFELTSRDRGDVSGGAEPRWCSVACRKAG
jgi:hypothetical protein